MENKSLQVKKESILKRIVNSIIALFKSNKTELEEITTVESKKKTSFIDQIKIEKEDQKLFEFQKKFESGEVNLDEISSEEIHKLNLLYDKQLIELQNELEVKRIELNTMKNKLNNNS